MTNLVGKHFIPSVGNLIPNGIHRKANIILRVMFLTEHECTHGANAHRFREIFNYTTMCAITRTQTQ